MQVCSSSVVTANRLPRQSRTSILGRLRLECHVVTGEFDYFMLVRTRDNDSYNRLHAEQLLYLPGVRQIRTFMTLKQVLSTTQLPIA
ncbi:Leucine-responsive regulatory protein (plasmid) [Ralstonia solanacearum]|nr:Leucine-responsive regulatory protein [Ralstonia solanacearum]